MYIHRFELKDLEEWSKSKKRKPLIIRGARQVGKTTLIRIFAETNKYSLVSINFEKDLKLQNFFSSNDPQQIIKLLSLQLNKDIIPKKSILFLDEIQAAPEVIKSLRYFYEEMPDLHVVAAGSLLEFTLSTMEFSMPVGRIEYMYLGPVSFENFLFACNEIKLVDFLNSYTLDYDYPISIHEKLMKFLKIYFIVGGMPESVALYLMNKDFKDVERVKQSIINTYRDDFSKYTSSLKNINKIQLVYDKIPYIVGNKVKYSNISKEYRTNIIAEAIEKLNLARIIYVIKHSYANGLPLGADINQKVFKTIFLDIGLLITNLGLSYLDFLRQDEITLINQGVIAEQFIGQHLLYNRPYYEVPNLYYWSRESKSASAEIDYLISFKNNIIPIEVKAGKSGTLKSLHYFLYEKQRNMAIRFNSNLPIFLKNEKIVVAKNNVNYSLLSLPLYFVNQIYRMLEKILLKC